MAIGASWCLSARCLSSGRIRASSQSWLIGLGAVVIGGLLIYLATRVKGLPSRSTTSAIALDACESRGIASRGPLGVQPVLSREGKRKVVATVDFAPHKN